MKIQQGKGIFLDRSCQELRILSVLMKQLTKGCMTLWAWMHTNAGRNIRRIEKHLNTRQIMSCGLGESAMLEDFNVWLYFYRDHESEWRAVSITAKLIPCLSSHSYLKLPCTTTESWWMYPSQMPCQIAEEEGNPYSERYTKPQKVLHLP